MTLLLPILAAVLYIGAGACIVVGLMRVIDAQSEGGQS